nr:hypothetical protein [Fibrobacter sp.]
MFTHALGKVRKIGKMLLDYRKDYRIIQNVILMYSNVSESNRMCKIYRAGFRYQPLFIHELESVRHCCRRYRIIKQYMVSNVYANLDRTLQIQDNNFLFVKICFQIFKRFNMLRFNSLQTTREHLQLRLQ